MKVIFKQGPTEPVKSCQKVLHTAGSQMTNLWKYVLGHILAL